MIGVDKIFLTSKLTRLVAKNDLWVKDIFDKKIFMEREEEEEEEEEWEMCHDASTKYLMKHDYWKTKHFYL